MGMVFCRACGKSLHDSAPTCPHCGAPQKLSGGFVVGAGAHRDWLPALLLCLFVGFLGVHRFYVGKIFTGILQLLTLGGLGIWTLIDFIRIAMGSFTNARGERLVSA
ncbi:MAG: TM2 domain-containing protein [Inhella sp.]|jgi:TM2 domain-containing membrane protein YozV|uniref:TM2 domain-containing protein n=1 Tax=Inhella sp. TaxID=1921806 RepID=UPI0022C4E53C|nr:TM2 domain-containing protein [Inhella sp.]MCZ8235566.1 TM2 domain-containing protein [Inhella sp.]